MQTILFCLSGDAVQAPSGHCSCSSASGNREPVAGAASSVGMFASCCCTSYSISQQDWPVTRANCQVKTYPISLPYRLPNEKQFFPRNPEVAAMVSPKTVDNLVDNVDKPRMLFALNPHNSRNHPQIHPRWTRMCTVLWILWIIAKQPWFIKISLV